MIDYYRMVLEFHQKYGHFSQPPVPTGVLPPEEVVELREKLIREESEEFSLASNKIEMIRADREPFDIAPHQVEIADALADLLYVVFGAAIAYGLPIEEIFTEVHRSNMTKSMLKDEKSIKGKTIKGPDWEPPNIKKILELHGWKDSK